MKTQHKTPLVIAGALALAAATGSAVAGPAPAYNLIPSGSAKFVPLNPKAPQGAQISIISGDPKTGPVAYLLKLPKGPSPVHWHSGNYHAVTIEGTTRHFLKGTEASATANAPGTVWYQPGGSAATAHTDECLSETCLAFVYMDKGFDLHVVAAEPKQ